MELEDKGYQIARSVVSNDVLALLRLQLELIIQSKHNTNNTTDPQYSFLKKRVGEYCSPVTEGLMLFVQPTIEKISGKKLLPTYSYVRRYFNGSTLPAHTDRSSCDYSVTLSIEADPNPWPIWIRDSYNHDVEVVLHPGDIMVYRGKQRPHWRLHYDSENHTQVFIHFVDADGPYAEFAFDARDSLAMPFEFQKVNDLEAKMRNANI